MNNASIIPFSSYWLLCRNKNHLKILSVVIGEMWTKVIALYDCTSRFMFVVGGGVESDRMIGVNGSDDSRELLMIVVEMVVVTCATSELVSWGVEVMTSCLIVVSGCGAGMAQSESSVVSDRGSVNMIIIGICQQSMTFIIDYIVNGENIFRSIRKNDNTIQGDLHKRWTRTLVSLKQKKTTSSDQLQNNGSTTIPGELHKRCMRNQLTPKRWEGVSYLETANNWFSAGDTLQGVVSGCGPRVERFVASPNHDCP